MPSYTFSDVMKLVPAMPVIAPFGSAGADSKTKSKYDSPDIARDAAADGDGVSRSSSTCSPAAANSLLKSKGTPDSSVSPNNSNSKHVKDMDKDSKGVKDSTKTKVKESKCKAEVEVNAVTKMCRVPSVNELLANCDDNLKVNDDGDANGVYLDREIAEALHFELTAYFVSSDKSGKASGLGDLTTGLRDRLNGEGAHRNVSAPSIASASSNSFDLLDLGTPQPIGSSSGMGGANTKRYRAFGPWAVVVSKNKDEAAQQVALPRALRYITFESACAGMPVVTLVATGRGDC